MSVIIYLMVFLSNFAEPHLSLGFSSGKRAAGSLGVGFHLKGLSHIARCPSTLEQHGVSRGVSISVGSSLDDLSLFFGTR
jgi:hypothetical protein